MAKIFGYGVDLSELNFDEEKIEAFIKKYLPDFAEEIEMNDVPVFECVDNYSNSFGYCGLSALLVDVINEQEKIHLSAYDSIPNGCIYISANYPWQFNKIEKQLTTKSTQEILEKYLSQITDDKIVCEDLSLYVESLD